MCDYNNASVHKTGMQDSAVKSQGCGHLFKAMGNILLATIWQIANRAQLFYVSMIPSATLHNGVGDTVCTDKMFPTEKKKASNDAFQDKLYK